MPEDRDNPTPRHHWRRRAALVGGGLCAAILLLLGPWPGREHGYADAAWARRTFERLDDARPLQGAGPLRAGAARRTIVVRAGEPLAGYGARDPKAAREDGELTVAAVSFAAGGATVTIAGGELLLVLPALRDEVLRRTGLHREEVYFTATHTHSGPGGYSPHPVFELILGAYREEMFDRLATALAGAISASREPLRPARLSVSHSPLRATGRLNRESIDRNRVTKGPATSHVSALRVAAEGRTLATLVVADAHPTCLPRDERLPDGDYPGTVRRTVEDAAGGVCLFMAGAVGSMKPAPHFTHGRRLARTTAAHVVRELRSLSPGEARSKLRIVSLRAPVELPPPGLALGNQLRISPAAGRFLHGRRTELHVLGIGPAVLVGMPADYSGELSHRLRLWCRAEGLPLPIVTSFNGDFVGYLLPHERYAKGGYETRAMNLFGPWCGEYVHRLAASGVRRVVRDFSCCEKPQVRSPSSDKIR